MNNKGQTLVIFVILLPILCILAGYTIEKCDLLYQKKILNEITETVCKYALDKNHNEEQIKQLALENDKKIQSIEITYLKQSKEVQIIVTKEKKSIFNIIGKDSYVIESTVKCIE